MKRGSWTHSHVPKACTLSTPTPSIPDQMDGWKQSSPFSSPNPSEPHLPPPTSALFPVLQAAFCICPGHVEFHDHPMSLGCTPVRF